MSNVFRKLGRIFVASLPASESLYAVCRLYVNRYNSENDGDMRANGELRFIQNALPKCATIFDIGANVGDWSKLALEINPKIDLHCFEPSAPTFAMLKRNNFPPTVICNNFGLGSGPGEMQLHLSDNGSGTNSLYQRQGVDEAIGSQSRTETIRLESVDRYCSEHKIASIDFMKMDVEGHELEVLKGASDLLKSRRIRIIQFEYGGCNIDSRVLLKDIWNIFSGLNYSFFKIYPKELRKFNEYRQTLENFQYQNWTIIRND